MVFSFKLRRCIGSIRRGSPLASPTTFQSDTPTAWISWLVDVFGVNWPVDRRTLHWPEVRCIINPTVGWPHGAHWLLVLAQFEWPIAHPVCTIARASQPAENINLHIQWSVVLACSLHWYTGSLTGWFKAFRCRPCDKGRCVQDVWQGSYRIPMGHSLSATLIGSLGKCLNSDIITEFVKKSNF